MRIIVPSPYIQWVFESASCRLVVQGKILRYLEFPFIFIFKLKLKHGFIDLFYLFTKQETTATAYFTSLDLLEEPTLTTD